jgi:outer membrane lipoprotein SlyB
MRHILTALAVVTLAACATANPNVVHPYEAQRMSPVYDATVLSARPVTIDGSQSGIGASAGAIAGGVAGSTVGHNGGAFVASVLGAVAGGVIGNAVERGATTQNGVEIIVQMRNGERRAIVQGATNETWTPGDPVVLVSTGGRTRVNHAPGVVQPAPPAPAAYPTPSEYPNAPVQPVVYPPSGPVPPRS